MAALALTDVLAGVPDPRSRHGRVHPLGAVLGLVVLGLLMGERSLSGIAQFGRDKGFALAIALGFRRGKTPVKSRLSTLFRRPRRHRLRGRLEPLGHGRAWPPGRFAHRIDGKTARGSKDGDAPGHHLWPPTPPMLRRSWPNSGWTPRPTNTRPPSNCWAFCRPRAALRRRRFLPARLLREDHGGGGDYVLTVKDNQPSLAIDIAAGLAFGDEKRRQAAAFPPYEEPPPPADSVAQSVDKGHGRIEKRTLRVTTILTKTEQWKGSKQGFELTRERTVKGRKTVEVVTGSPA